MDVDELLENLKDGSVTRHVIIQLSPVDGEPENVEVALWENIGDPHTVTQVLRSVLQTLQSKIITIEGNA